MKILLIEDDSVIAKGLLYSLKQNGYDTQCMTCAKDANDFLRDSACDFVILDVSLPDGNGFNIYENVIIKKKIPTIFLTARDDEDDIVKGLELGAEDYMTKPFSIKELMARIKKITCKRKEKNIIRVKDVSCDLDKMEVYNKDGKIELTSLELKLFHLLITNLNKVITRDEIIEKIWEWTGNDVNDNTASVYLKRIREKIKTNIIQTVKGIGYRIDEDGK